MTSGHVRQFANRACLYAALDLRLSGRTRFYSAASLVNDMFASFLSAAPARLWISGSTTEFLLHLGSHLEPINMARASAIHRSRLSPHIIDRLMVSLEQDEVQSQIDRLKTFRPQIHASAIRDLDHLLSATFSRHLACMVVEALPATYRTAIDTAREELGRALSFSRKNDRESVGRALITVIRLQTEGIAIPDSSHRGVRARIPSLLG